MPISISNEEILETPVIEETIEEVLETPIIEDSMEEVIELSDAINDEIVVVEETTETKEVVEEETKEEKAMPTFDLPEVDDYEEYDFVLDENTQYHQNNINKKRKGKSLLKGLLLIAILLGIAVVAYILVKEFLI